MAKKKPAPEESAEVKRQEAEENNRCFIITPVGDDNSEMHRAADGLIDAVIAPVLADLEMVLVAPHRGYDPISITGRIVRDIVESKLVIANLTGLNPNVMYELAVRHAVAKPIVIVADRSTRLPFDIKDELTVFYDNDMSGVVELDERLRRAIDAAQNSPRIDNPITRYKEGVLMSRPGAAPDALQVVLDRMDGMERAISRLSSPRPQPIDTGFRLARRTPDVDEMSFLVGGEGTFSQYTNSNDQVSTALKQYGIKLIEGVRMSSGEVVVIVRSRAISPNAVQEILEDALRSSHIKFEIVSLRKHSVSSDY